jgi:hypothetical protein
MEWFDQSRRLGSGGVYQLNVALTTTATWPHSPALLYAVL